MKSSHIHVNVKDLQSATHWMEKTLAFKPAFQNDRMAVVPVGGFSIIFDAANHDTVATIAFDSEDCKSDFNQIAARGVEVIEGPTEQPWGVIAAYIKGPGQLTFEIEQILK